jgi:hypothetical protein
MPLVEAKAGRVPSVTAPCSQKREIRAWAVMVTLGLATLIAGYILWAKVSGF